MRPGFFVSHSNVIGLEANAGNGIGFYGWKRTRRHYRLLAPNHGWVKHVDVDAGMVWKVAYFDPQNAVMKENSLLDRGEMPMWWRV